MYVDFIIDSGSSYGKKRTLSEEDLDDPDRIPKKLQVMSIHEMKVMSTTIMNVLQLTYVHRPPLSNWIS